MSGAYIEYDDKIIFHPGYYVQEIIESKNMTKSHFANLLSVPKDYLDRLLKGKDDITMFVAQKLSYMSGTSVNYWLNLQKAFDEGVEKIEQ